MKQAKLINIAANAASAVEEVNRAARIIDTVTAKP